MNDKNCSTCAYWQKIGNVARIGSTTTNGICRARPPVPVALLRREGPVVLTVWPETTPEQVCGMHETNIFSTGAE
jgi:hypothetical protein